MGNKRIVCSVDDMNKNFGTQKDPKENKIKLKDWSTSIQLIGCTPDLAFFYQELVERSWNKLTCAEPIVATSERLRVYQCASTDLSGGHDIVISFLPYSEVKEEIETYNQWRIKINPPPGQERPQRVFQEFYIYHTEIRLPWLAHRVARAVRQEASVLLSSVKKELERGFGGNAASAHERLVKAQQHLADVNKEIEGFLFRYTSPELAKVMTVEDEWEATAENEYFRKKKAIQQANQEEEEAAAESKKEWNAFWKEFKSYFQDGRTSSLDKPQIKK